MSMVNEDNKADVERWQERKSLTIGILKQEKKGRIDLKVK